VSEWFHSGYSQCPYEPSLHLTYSMMQAGIRRVSAEFHVSISEVWTRFCKVKPVYSLHETRATQPEIVAYDVHCSPSFSLGTTTRPSLPLPDFSILYQNRKTIMPSPCMLFPF
jgi:hypothetical protein